MSTSSKRSQGRISKEKKESNEDEIWRGTFPDEVVLEILSRLPPKPFFRFKCVSKTWLALSSRAGRLNKLLQPTLLGLLYMAPPFSGFKFGFIDISDGVDVVYPKLKALSHYDDIGIVNSCNGVFLVKCEIFEPSFSSENMYVYNPTTQKRSAVELIPRVYFEDESYDETFSLAFDPQDQSHFHVVCFMQWHCPCLSYDNNFLTFSPDSGTWQRGGSLECSGQIERSANGTFLGGRVHRVTNRHEIVSVDPKNNTCLVTRFDFPGLSGIGTSEIGQSQGLLHFMYVNKSHEMSIWVSENGDPQNWILKHQLNLEGMHLVNASFRNIRLHPGKDVIFVHGEDRRILSIDLTNGEPNKIYYTRGGSCSSFWLYMPCFPV